MEWENPFRILQKGYFKRSLVENEPWNALLWSGLLWQNLHFNFCNIVL